MAMSVPKKILPQSVGFHYKFDTIFTFLAHPSSLNVYWPCLEMHHKLHQDHVAQRTAIDRYEFFTSLLRFQLELFRKVIETADFK